MPFIENKLLTKSKTVAGVEYSNYLESVNSHINISKDTNIIFPVDTSQNILLNSLSFDAVIDGRNEANRYWQFILYEVTEDFNFIYLWNSDTSQLNTYFSQVNNLNIFLNNLATNSIFFMLEMRKVGKPGSISLANKLTYQHYQIIN